MEKVRHSYKLLGFENADFTPSELKKRFQRIQTHFTSMSSGNLPVYLKNSASYIQDMLIDAYMRVPSYLLERARVHTHTHGVRMCTQSAMHVR